MSAAPRITLGVIADDFTGATDVAGMLVRGGLRAVQVIGVPAGALPDDDAVDAVVVALKSRTTPAADAVRESLAALQWLRAAGARQVYFKYCSTFDSTPRGNIGPVAEALMDALDTDFTIACPAFPENGRTIFRGHLFVGDTLLSDSGMREHPLTPMTDANLVRVLQAQTRGAVGLLRHDTVARGAAAIRAGFEQLRSEGVRIAVADAIDNDDLRALAAASVDLPLVSAGSGLALGLADAYAAAGWVRPAAVAGDLAPVGGLAAVLSGSCSSATHAQVQHWLQSGRPGFRIDPLALAAGTAVEDEALRWAGERLPRGPVLIYATAPAHEVKAVQAALGAAQAGQRVEACLAAIARALCGQLDVRRLVVAGGETSGAVVQALGVHTLRVGAPIDPGVPWMQAHGRALLLALKSGNFGSVDFFAKALALVS